MQQSFHYVWFPYAAYAFYAALFVLAAAAYALRGKPFAAKFGARVTVRRVAIAAAAFRVCQAGILTLLQWLSWSNGGVMGRAFLEAKLDRNVPTIFATAMPWLFDMPHGYFVYYAFGRFWLNAALSIAAAWIFYRLLLALRKFRDRFFEDGEPELGFAMALVAGWPLAVAFIAFAFAAVVPVSLFRRAVLKEELTTLGWPFVVAGALSFFAGAFFIGRLGLSTLAV